MYKATLTFTNCHQVQTNFKEKSAMFFIKGVFLNLLLLLLLLMCYRLWACLEDVMTTPILLCCGLESGDPPQASSPHLWSIS
jgi:hypothetical protein